MKKVISFCLLLISTGFVSALAPISPEKDTALIQAIKYGNSKQVKKLVKENKGSINAFGIDYKTAMDVAVEYGDAKTALLLSRYGGKLTRVNNVEVFKTMLQYRARRLLITFFVMFILAPLVLSPLSICVELAQVSIGCAMLVLPLSCGCLIYAGYEWSRLFKALSMYSRVEQNWMIGLPKSLS